MDAKRPARSRGWVTIFDVAAVIVAAAALVALLGAQGRFTLAGLRVTIRSPLNLTMAAAILIALRLVLARTQPLVPSLPRPGVSPFERDRLRFASPDRWSRRAVLCALAVALGSIVWIL